PRLHARGAGADRLVRRGARPEPGRRVQLSPAEARRPDPPRARREGRVPRPRDVPAPRVPVLPVRLLQGSCPAEAPAPDVLAPARAPALRALARGGGRRLADRGARARGGARGSL